MRISVQPELLTWALQRSRIDADDMRVQFPRIHDWIKGNAKPTMKQLEKFAKLTHLPLGLFFLSEPPDINIPVTDFRTMLSVQYDQPTLDLIDTIYLCQQRQYWYRDILRLQQSKELEFIGKTSIRDDVIKGAEDIRNTIGFTLRKREHLRKWTDALRLFIDQVEKNGILVMVSGVVGNNNYRKLDPEEFRGFALVDRLAPLIFINANDTLSAKMFTLAHELAHLWLGESGISNPQMSHIPDIEVERWCNSVAAELLVPIPDFGKNYNPNTEINVEMERLAQKYKVSTLVILRRINDLGHISERTFLEIWNNEFERLINLERQSGVGGDFYRTLGTRISKRLMNTIIVSTLEGQTLFRDAYRMLGIKKHSTFLKIAEKLGYPV